MSYSPSQYSFTTINASPSSSSSVQSVYSSPTSSSVQSVYCISSGSSGSSVRILNTPISNNSSSSPDCSQQSLFDRSPSESMRELFPETIEVSPTLLQGHSWSGGDCSPSAKSQASSVNLFHPSTLLIFTLPEQEYKEKMKLAMDQFDRKIEEAERKLGLSPNTQKFIDSQGNIRSGQYNNLDEDFDLFEIPEEMTDDWDGEDGEYNLSSCELAGSSGLVRDELSLDNTYLPAEMMEDWQDDSALPGSSGLVNDQQTPNAIEDIPAEMSEEWAEGEASYFYCKEDIPSQILEDWSQQ